MRSLFSNRTVQAILLSGIFLQMGIWVRNFAILLFVTEQTDKDPLAISLIYIAEFAPIFLFSFIGGAFADRWRPKRTMVLCDLLSALSVFVVLLALFFGGWEAIFFATLVSSVLSQFSQPSGMKLFKLHVPESQIQLGMSMYQTTSSIFMILGPMILGGGIAMGISKKMTPQSMLMVGFVTSAISVAVLGSVNVIWIAFMAQLIFGLMVPFIHIACNTLILNHAEEAFVGRVNGILNPLFMGAVVINMSLVGVLKDQLPLTALYLIASGLFALGALSMLPLLRFKQIRPVQAAEWTHH